MISRRLAWRNRPSIQTIERSNCEGLLQLLKRDDVVLFIIMYPDGNIDALSQTALAVLQHYGVQATIYDVAAESQMESDVQRFSGWQYFPQLFVRSEFIGGTMILDEYFASGEFSRMTGISTSSQKKTSKKTHHRGPGRALWRISFSPRNDVLACAGADGHLTVGHFGRRMSFSRKPCHKGWVNAVCFDANEQKIITAGTDRAVRILDIATRGESVIYAAHDRWINDLAPIPNSCRVVSASADRTIGLWDTKESLLIARSPTSTNPYWCVCALNDGQRIASGDASGQISFFRAHDLSFDARIGVHSNCIAAIVPDWSDGLISGSHDGLVKWIGVRGVRQVFLGHKKRVWSVATLPDDCLAAGAADGRVLVWHRNRQLPINEIPIEESPLSMVWWPGGNCLLVGTIAGNLWRLNPHAPADSICLT